mgnify:CR=1 FL=1
MVVMVLSRGMVLSCGGRLGACTATHALLPGRLTATRSVHAPRAGECLRRARGELEARPRGWLEGSSVGLCAHEGTSEMRSGVSRAGMCVKSQRGCGVKWGSTSSQHRRGDVARGR